MTSGADYIREFLAHMGVAAEVLINDANERIVIIETEEFNRRRVSIETWFTLIEESDGYCYFRERPRGTGQTM